MNLQRPNVSFEPTMSRHFMACLALLLFVFAGCAESPVQPEPEPPPLVFDVKVNVQLGDSQVGVRPLYVVTGSIVATQDGVRRETTLDSVVIEYNRNLEPWTRLRRLFAIPFSDRLPFIVQPGDAYHILARLYATAYDEKGQPHEKFAEWLTTGSAIP